jgi:ribosomal protein S14
MSSGLDHNVVRVDPSVDEGKIPLSRFSVTPEERYVLREISAKLANRNIDRKQKIAYEHQRCRRCGRYITRDRKHLGKCAFAPNRKLHCDICGRFTSRSGDHVCGHYRVIRGSEYE